MATNFFRVRPLINCTNDVGGPGSETWDLLSDDLGTLNGRAMALCKARAKLLGVNASLIGYQAALLAWDGNQTFRTQRRNLGRGFGNPALGLRLGAGGDFPPLDGIANSREVFASYRSVAARGNVFWNDGSSSKTRLCFPWFVCSRDFSADGWVDQNTALAEWLAGVGGYARALRGGVFPSNPFGRFHRIEFGRLDAAWPDAIIAMQGGDGVSTLGGVLVKGNLEDKYKANTFVTIGGRRPGRRGSGERGNEGGHFRVGQPGAKFNSSTGYTTIPLTCTVRKISWDPCKTSGYIWPDKWEFRSVLGYESAGHGTTRRATARGARRGVGV